MPYHTDGLAITLMAGFLDDEDSYSTISGGAVASYKPLRGYLIDIRGVSY